MASILITGITGFIGTNIAKLFLNYGYEVFGLYKTEPSLSKKIKFIQGAIEDKEQLKAVLIKYKFDYIVHLAAQSSPPKSWEIPHETFKINVLGTLNLLECIHELGINPRLIVAGSSAEYKETSSIRISESFQTMPRDPYGISKLASTNLCINYHNKYNLDIMVIRPFFVIGIPKTGDVTSDLVRLTLRHLKNSSTPIVIGNPNITRDFVDIEDAIYGIYFVAIKGKPGEIYNICTGNGRSIKDLISTLELIVQSPLITISSHLKFRKNEVLVIVGDHSKISNLGWKQQKSYTSSIQEIYNYWSIQD